MSWKQTARLKRETVLASIPREWRLAQEEIGGRTKQRNVVGSVAEHISTNSRGITEQPVAQLLQRLQRGDVTASEVLVSMPNLREVFLSSCCHSHTAMTSNSLLINLD